MQLNLFSPDTYSRRREILAKEVGHGLIWILGNSEAPKNYMDNPYPFRQDSSFLYYAGIDHPDLSLLLDVDAGKTYLCGDDRSVDLVVWMGPMPSLSELGAKVGIEHTLTTRQLDDRLDQAVSRSEKVHFLPPYRGHSAIRVATCLKKDIGRLTTEASDSLIRAIVKQRSVKEAQELTQMEEALSITRDMHLEVIYETKPGKKESDLMANLLAVAARHNVDLAYPVILTINGQTLHSHDHSHRIREGQLLLGDFGAECPMHYAGDITRTIPVSGHFDEMQKEIYRLVLAGQKTAIDMMRPGVAYRDIHLASARTMAQGLIDLNLMKGDVDEAVHQGAHALFFPHGLGHMIGLDVHDMEDLGEELVGYNDQVKRSEQFGFRSLRFGKHLSPGNVLTVEPGLYFIPELIDMWESQKKHDDFICYDKLKLYRHFGGIRIEDNYVVTESGKQLLGPPIPKEIDEIEFLMSADRYNEG